MLRLNTVKPVYNDHLIRWFSDSWSSSTWMSSRRQTVPWQSHVHHQVFKIKWENIHWSLHQGGRYRQVSLYFDIAFCVASHTHIMTLGSWKQCSDDNDNEKSPMRVWLCRKWMSCCVLSGTSWQQALKPYEQDFVFHYLSPADTTNNSLRPREWTMLRKRYFLTYYLEWKCLDIEKNHWDFLDDQYVSHHCLR